MVGGIYGKVPPRNGDVQGRVIQMYVLGWLFFILIIALWRRDVKAAREIYARLISEVRRERAELEALKKSYMMLLPKEGGKEDG